MNFIWPDGMTEDERDQAKQALVQRINGFLGMLAAVTIGIGMYLIAR